jgi:hypothetical protein
MVPKCVTAGAWSTRASDVRQRTIAQGKDKKNNCGTEGGEKKTRKRTKRGSINPMYNSPSWQSVPGLQGTVPDDRDIDRWAFPVVFGRED